MKKLILCAFLPAALAFGQSGETDVGEIGAYAGGVFGIGSHPTTGLTFMTALSRYTMFGADLGFTSLGDEGYHTALASVINRSRLYDFNGNVQVRIPVRRYWEPYIVIGAGLLHSTAEQRVSTAGENTTTKLSENDFAFQIGVGVRYFITDSWGVRPEWKYYATDRSFSKLTVGVFYQFP